jgi:predicted amidophosphoribosyltransferase
VEGCCAECADWPDELVRADAAFLFEPPAVRIVHGLKYAGWTALAPRMGALMAPVARRLGTQHTVLVPVPLTPARLRERGFNQARLLAEGVGAELGWPVESILRRTSADRQQARSGRKERALNVAGAYRVVPSGASAAGPGPTESGRVVLVVDDVITTGATIAACATALAGCGIRCLGAVSFARTPPRSPGG